MAGRGAYGGLAFGAGRGHRLSSRELLAAVDRWQEKWAAAQARSSVHRAVVWKLQCSAPAAGREVVQSQCGGCSLSAKLQHWRIDNYKIKQALFLSNSCILFGEEKAFVYMKQLAKREHCM